MIRHRQTFLEKERTKKTYNYFIIPKECLRPSITTSVRGCESISASKCLRMGKCLPTGAYTCVCVPTPVIRDRGVGVRGGGTCLPPPTIFKIM